MTRLDEIRVTLTEDARAVINAVWDYHLDKKKCMPTTALSVRLGEDIVLSAVKALNGSIVIEQTGGGVKRCCLTFLGALLSENGRRGEELLKRLLEYMQSSLLTDPEFTTVDSEIVKQVLSLTDEQFQTLSQYFWLSPFTGGGGGAMDRWSFSLPYYMSNDLPLEKDLGAYIQSYALKGFDGKLPVLDDDRRRYLSKKDKPSLMTHVFYSWQSDLPNATNRGFIEKALEDAAKSIREDGSIQVEPVVDRDTAGVPGSPDIATTILDKIERSDVFVCDVSIINQGASRPAPNPNVLIELGYALKVLGPERIIMVLNSAYGGPELLPFDLRMRRVIPYEMSENHEDRAPVRKRLQRVLTEGLRAIFGGFAGEMPGELIQPEPPVQQIGVTSFLSSGDEEVEDYVTRLLTTNNEAEFNIVIEKLRDATVSVWDLKREIGEEAIEKKILHIKHEVFLPAVRKLVLLGLLLIKFSAPAQWFGKIADLLEEIFSSSHSLTRLVPELARQRPAKTIDELANHMVPALESLIATYLLGGYELSKRKSTIYAAKLFPRVVNIVGDPYTRLDVFFLFWPIDSGFWQPNRQRDLLALDRYGNDVGIAAITGGEKAIRTAALQLDCLVDWHSFMSTDQSKDSETVEFFKHTFPKVSTWFEPNFTHEPFAFIYSFIEQLWRTMQDGGKSFFVLDDRLAALLEGIGSDRRKRLFARFLIYAERTQSTWMAARGQIPWPPQWPTEIQELVSEVRNIDRINP